MTSKLTRERLQEIAEDGFLKHGENKELARMALAAMDQKPAIHRYRRKSVEPYGPYPWHYEEFVDLSRPIEGIEDEYYYAAPPVITGFAVDGESECLPLDYLQGHKDGLEWAAQLAEANHPETGDWLYDDPIDLAKAIRKGPDMPPVQPVAGSEPVAEVLSNRPGNDTSTIDRALPVGTQLYRHAQQPVVPDEWTIADAVKFSKQNGRQDAGAAMDAWNACRAATLQAGNSPAHSGLRPEQIGVSPAQSHGWIPVSERMPERGDYLVTDGSDFDVQTFDGEQFYPGFVWEDKITHWMPLPAAPQEVNGE